MKGAYIDSSNTSSFGRLSKLKNAGNYEYNYINQKNGNIITLKNNLLRSYDIPDGVVQLVRTPYYTNAIVTTELTAPPFDGEKGGVLSILVKETLTLQQNINTSGKGFRGGIATNTQILSRTCYLNDYAYPLSSLLAAPKGESISIISDNIISGKGKLATGGGGGLDHNSGGGGGGNGGSGGFGGYQLDNCGIYPFDNRGIGGDSIDYDLFNNKLFLGGGGGAGHCNQVGGINMDGGSGGGIIIIQANTIAPNGFAINSSGNNAIQCNLSIIDNCHDGNGGGGGGGAIVLDIQNYSSQPVITAKGGKGADLIVYFPAAGRIGPGGGGGGGIVFANSTDPLIKASINIDAGINGVILPDNNNPYGATPGQKGLFSDKWNPLTFDSTLFIINKDFLSFKDTIVNCKTVYLESASSTPLLSGSKLIWALGDETIDSSKNIIHNYINPGDYTITLIGSSEYGCSDTTEKILTFNPVNAEVNIDTLVCSNTPVHLFGSGGSSYKWEPSQFLNNQNIPNPVAQVSNTTKFFVTVKNDIGCFDYDSVTISIREIPKFNKPANKIICEGDSLTIITNNAVSLHYQWSPSSEFKNNNDPSPIIKPIQSKEYELQIEESVCGYDTTFKFTIRVNPKPEINVSKTNDITCSQLSARLIANGAKAYSWVPANMVTDSNASTTTVLIDKTTYFQVKGINEFGCFDTSGITVTLAKTGDLKTPLPNAFTPNGDFKNDCFGIQHWGNQELIEFSIYNRWGQKIFTTKNIELCWDGKFKGKEQDAGGYIYVIKSHSFCGDVFKKGIVYLIR